MPDADTELSPDPAGTGPAGTGTAGTGADGTATAEASTGPPDPGTARRRRGYFLPGAIALAALLLIGAAVGAGDLAHPAPESLRGTDVASQISLGVQAEQNDPAPPQVTCPPSEPVRAGLRFGCTLISARGQRVAVTVTEADGRGRLHWSLGSVGVTPAAK